MTPRTYQAPGPGTWEQDPTHFPRQVTQPPRDRGVLRVVERALDRELPLFGVCLGHQGIAEYFGGELGVMDTPMHGKPSPITHQGAGVLAGLPSPFAAGRYHSLYVKRQGLPAELEVTAESGEGMIMALRHNARPIASVQFHPESILTLKEDVGQRLVENLFTQ